jgi:hypothetical protein
MKRKMFVKKRYVFCEAGIYSVYFPLFRRNSGCRVLNGHPKNPQYALLRRGSKIMSHVSALRHVKNPSGILVNSDPLAKLRGSSRLRW